MCKMKISSEGDLEIGNSPEFVVINHYAGTGWSLRINEIDCYIDKIVMSDSDPLVVYAPYTDGVSYAQTFERRVISLWEIKAFHIY